MAILSIIVNIDHEGICLASDQTKGPALNQLTCFMINYFRNRIQSWQRKYLLILWTNCIRHLLFPANNSTMFKCERNRNGATTIPDLVPVTFGIIQNSLRPDIEHFIPIHRCGLSLFEKPENAPFHHFTM